MELRQIVDDNYSTLLECMDPSIKLLGNLHSVAFLKDRVSSIKRQATAEEKNDALLTALQEVPDDIQEPMTRDFTAALRSCGQEHVANIFRRDSDQVPMSGEHRSILIEQTAELCEFLDPENGVLDRLFSSKVISQAEDSRIRSKEGFSSMVRELINIILRKSDDAFQLLVDALNESGQKHVAYILTGQGDSQSLSECILSDEHRNILVEQTAELCEFLDPENGVLDRLFSSKVISQAEDSRIRSKEGFSSMVRELISIILRKSDDAFQLLVNALNENGQNHVAYILTGEGDIQPLSEYCRKRLTEKRKGVVESIYTPELVTPLVSSGIFTKYDQERVEARETPSQRSEMMVDLIARKSQTAFDSFICTLQQYYHEHVVEELMGPEVAAEIEAKFCDEVPEGEKEVLVRRVRKIMQEALTNNNDETKVKRLAETLDVNGISVSEVKEGSIIVKFKCSDRAALESLEQLHRSNRLDQLFTEAFCPDLVGEGLESLGVVISDDESHRHEALRLMKSENREVLLESEEWLRGKITVNDDLLNKLSLSKRRKEAIEAAAKRDQQVHAVIYSLSRESRYMQKSRLTINNMMKFIRSRQERQIDYSKIKYNCNTQCMKLFIYN